MPEETEEGLVMSKELIKTCEDFGIYAGRQPSLLEAKEERSYYLIGGIVTAVLQVKSQDKPSHCELLELVNEHTDRKREHYPAVIEKNHGKNIMIMYLEDALKIFSRQFKER